MSSYRHDPAELTSPVARTFVSMSESEKQKLLTASIRFTSARIGFHQQAFFAAEAKRKKIKNQETREFWNLYRARRKSGFPL